VFIAQYLIAGPASNGRGLPGTATTGEQKALTIACHGGGMKGQSSFVQHKLTQQHAREGLDAVAFQFRHFGISEASFAHPTKGIE